jgi:hypothetical protein
MMSDGGSKRGSGDLQPGSRPEPEIIDFGHPHGPDELPNRFKEVGGETPHLFWGGFGGRSGPCRLPKLMIVGSGREPGGKSPKPWMGPLSHGCM